MTRANTEVEGRRKLLVSTPTAISLNRLLYEVRTFSINSSIMSLAHTIYCLTYLQVYGFRKASDLDWHIHYETVRTLYVSVRQR